MTNNELEHLLDEYGRAIYSFCLSLTRSVNDAEDLYQDTFLWAVDKLEKIDKDNNPRSYLLAIAANLWKNKRKKHLRRGGIMHFEVITEENKDLLNGQGLPSLEEEVLQKEIAATVQVIVAELADKWRMPVYLYYMLDLSIEEIATILRIPKGTVKSRLYKARDIIKKRLEAFGYER